MEKKSPVIGGVLGFFIIGLIYAGGVKKGLIYFVGLCALSTAIAACVTPHLSIVANAIGAYLGYTWVNQHNAAIDGSVSTDDQQCL